MKTTLALITVLLISQNAIARDCETKVEINVYSSQVGMPAPQSVSLDDSKRIGRIAKAMEQVGYQITENNDPALTAKIEAELKEEKNKVNFSLTCKSSVVKARYFSMVIKTEKLPKTKRRT
jgi:hypothetical protein